jgi:hypothetical protein
MRPLIESVLEAFTARAWVYDRDNRYADALSFTYDFNGIECPCQCKVFDGRVFNCICIYPVTIEESRIEAMAELVARLNEPLLVGGFRINYDQRFVCFFLSNAFPSDEGAPEEIATLIECCTRMVEEHHGCLSSVMKGDLSPAQVMRLKGLIDESQGPQDN